MFGKLIKIAIIPLVTVFIACGGGGSSSNSDLVIEGQLTQGADAAHDRAYTFKHGAGEAISEVEICALGACSLTDDQGQYGFLASSDFEGGEVLVTVKGHGIDSDLVIDLPNEARDVFLHIENNNGLVIAHHVEIDGVRVEEQQHAESDEHDDTMAQDHAH